MFERYTLKARQAVFFARLEAELRESDQIYVRHLLTGVVLVGPKTIESLIGAKNVRDYGCDYTAEEAWHRMLTPDPTAPATETSSVLRPQGVSRDMPLSSECQRVFDSAAEQANGV